jgi:2-haloacid dehalogenase
MSVFGPLFYRMLHMAGISSPRTFASDADKDFILDSYMELEMRPGAKECIEILREGGFTVWAYTAEDLKRVGGYFDAA